MKNLIKTAATATLVAMIAAVPMASIAATKSSAPSSAFTEVPRDIANGPAKPANILSEGDVKVEPVSYATSPNLGAKQPANVILGGDENRGTDPVGAR